MTPADGPRPSDTTLPALKGLRVQILSMYFAPDGAGIAPYATAYADCLSRNGAMVTVDTGLPHYPAWRVPPQYRGRRRLPLEGHRGIVVRRHRHAVPRRHGLLGRLRYEVSFLSSVMTAPTAVPDLVLAVTPTLSGALAGAWFARRARVPFGIIAQDLVGLAAAQAGVSGGRRIAGVLGQVESWVMRRADVIGVITPAFRNSLNKGGVLGNRLMDLPNHTLNRMPVLRRSVAREILGWPLDRPVVLHAGNMGVKQDLVTVVEAAREACTTDAGPLLVLMGDGNERAAIEAAAARLDNVVVCGPVAEEFYPSALAAADLLLVNERPTVRGMSLPSKLTSYFAAGRPVVARVPNDGATAEEIRRSGGGIVVGLDRHALYDGIANLLSDLEATRRLGDCGRRYADTVLDAAAAETRLLDLVGRLTALSRGHERLG